MPRKIPDLVTKGEFFVAQSLLKLLINSDVSIGDLQDRVRFILPTDRRI